MHENSRRPSIARTNALLHWAGGANRRRARASAGSRAAGVVGARTHGCRRGSTLGASPTPEEELSPSCSMPLAADAHPSCCLSSTPAGRRATRGMPYPADAPTVEEIVAVMSHAGDGVHGRRLRGLIVVLWRAGLRICEALALAEADLDPADRCWYGAARAVARPRRRGGLSPRWDTGTPYESPCCPGDSRSSGAPRPSR
jgi:integrase